MDALNDMTLNGNRRVAGFTLRSGPVTAATPLIDHQGIEPHVVPTQPDQFADPQAGVHRNVKHRGIGLRYQLHEFVELLSRDIRLPASLADLDRRKLHTLHWVSYEELVANRSAKDAGKHITNLVLRFVGQR